MKRPAPDMTVEQLVALLGRSGLFTDADLVTLEQRWQVEAGDTADPQRFTRWLVARQYLSEPQADLLALGQLDRLPPPVSVPAALPPPADRAAPIALDAVIMAPAAPARSARVVPKAVAAPANVFVAPPAPALPAEPSRTPVLPNDAEINVELVHILHVVAPESIPPPPVEPQFSVELVPLEEPAPPPIAPATPSQPADAANLWMHLLLGALGLLGAQIAGWLFGWLLAHLIS